MRFSDVKRREGDSFISPKQQIDRCSAAARPGTPSNTRLPQSCAGKHDPAVRDAVGRIVRAQVAGPADLLEPGPRGQRFHAGYLALRYSDRVTKRTSEPAQTSEPPQTKERPFPEPGAAAQLQNARFRAGAAIALAVVVGLILWLALRDTGGSSTSTNAKAVSVADIRTLAASVGHPIFWVGPKQGYTYEVTRPSNGSIYVRYLPPGEKVGVKKPYLTVATYPFAGAYEAIQKITKQKGITPIKLAHGGLGEAAARSPQSVHVAYPGIDYQVEVYDPTPGTATGLVATGKLAVFGSLKPSSPRAASLAQLKSLAASLGHPIYWIGRKRGYTYELVRTSQGQVYIRYLPPGVGVRARGQYLTVATYPFKGAFDAILKLAEQQNATTLTLSNGGRAVIDPTNPKSIHLAYPGSDVEIEVFDPSPARGRQIVSSGQITTVG